MARKHPAEALFGEGAPRVVAISRAGRRPRAAVLLSDESTLKVSATAASIVGLKEGTVVDDSLRRELLEAEEVAQVVRTMVRLLAASAKTAGELRERLLARGVGAGVVERALGHVASHGLIDDGAIARSIVEKPAMSRAMARHLMEVRRVPSEVIESTLGSLKDGKGVLEAARHLSVKIPGSLSPEARRRRLMTALARRGFEGDEAWEAALRVIPGAGKTSDTEPC